MRAPIATSNRAPITCISENTHLEIVTEIPVSLNLPRKRKSATFLYVNRPKDFAH